MKTHNSKLKTQNSKLITCNVGQGSQSLEQTSPKVTSYKFQVTSFKLQAIRRKGFTLIETLVAVSILAIAIIGPLSIANKGLFSSLFARDQITAFFLAQDAMEYIRNMRDTNLLNGNNWDYVMKEKCGMTTGTNPVQQACVIDTTVTDFTSDFAVKTCADLECGEYQMYYHPGNGLYNYQGNDDEAQSSVFGRKIQFSSVRDDLEGRVQIDVSWNTGIGENTIKTFTVQENIFNQVEI